LPEVWIQQDREGLFLAVDAQSGKIFRHPSRLRYEVAFLSKEIFECSVQCLKERTPASLYELAVVTFAIRPGFGVEAGCLLAPEDYAGETSIEAGQEWVPFPPRIEPKAS
jgi:hypothetical protein